MESQGQRSDLASEWCPPEPETRLEESMWQLGLGGDGGGVESYPERPGEADCTHYLRTGYCGYGPRCRFNHPADRSSVAGVMRAAGGEFPERMGEPVCQYYMRTGMCKFGASCKYDHPRQGGGSAIPIATNIYGYPLRPGEIECAYYVKTGQCKFGLMCKFDHPQPACTQVQVPPGGPLSLATPVPTAIYQTLQSLPAISSEHYGVVTENWPLARPALVPGSYVQGAYGPMLLPQGMVALLSWNPYQAPVTQVGFPSTQSIVGGAPLYGITQLSATASAYKGAYLPSPSTTVPSSSSPKEKKFPERPGEAECQYYMKTGDCKFGSSCRYHHPPDWNPPQLSFTISPFGFPLRPGAPLCAHYAHSGMCKLGQACKFDHPIATLGYSPSVSSLADIPIAPYPVGSSLGTLAPSSSSSGLKGSEKDTVSSKNPSSITTPRGSVGSILSKSGPTRSQGGDVHTSS